ncbi:MAG: excinuclease ABC subunit UvrA [Clostridia bacterium]|nr:excinuclease ABC subunit UvrA [Clostridia bacterium]MDE7329012.1 excinuclease ABC subunit UvrA [Clostridia bacterium]
MQDSINIKGARVHNLKNIDIKIPRDKLVVLTGLSGSGKSSLAFDTIFAEGQRRYMESLSSYARQFLGQMDKPDVDYIDGLSPAISIDQKTTSHNPRSTVGTVTEIYDYLRLLYARIGLPHCPHCGKEIVQQSVDQIADKVLLSEAGAKIRVLAPIVRGRKGEFAKQIEGYRKSGYSRLIVDGSEYNIVDEEVKLDKNIKHNIKIVIDRIVMKPDVNRRLTDSLETALKLAEGLVEVEVNGEITLYSSKYSCPDCDVSIEELQPRMFSFNSPFGACPECYGLGFKTALDINKLVKWDKSLAEGALDVSGWNMDFSNFSTSTFMALAKRHNFSLRTPLKDLPKNIIDILLYGDEERLEISYNSAMGSGTFNRKFEGVANNIMRRFRETSSEYVKQEFSKLMKEVPCDCCHGKRLRKEVLGVTVGGKNIDDVCSLSIDKALEFFENLSLTPTQEIIANQILKEIKARLGFLVNVGLNYLQMSRASATLSGGEAQRIRLATQIGSGLVGVLYILDEPSIGLHQRDNDKLLATLERLRDLGNTLIVVEHDEDTMRKADYIIDIGPGAGVNGGEVVVAGTPEEVMACDRSITGAYMSGRERIELPTERRSGNGKFLQVKGAKKNNLKNIDVDIPLGTFTVITGVSGSGKSSLINEVLYPVLQNQLNGARASELNCKQILGIDELDKVIAIDQSPIGRTPRSNPATYTNVFNAIRDLYAKTPEAKSRGYKSGRFSFNIAGGRCENCAGDGIKKIEMHFLSDVYVPCEVCGGKRYNRETLQVKYKGKSIYEVLEMTVAEACEFFENIPQIYNKINTLNDVGLSYVKLGQPATTLSGGEAQRVKLATELSKRSTGKTVYILDEPTTGLHSADVKKLVAILQRLVSKGNTVVVIEHNLDVIKVADYIIDLGPEGGEGGGTVVVAGTPEQVAECERSYTGKYLKDKLI